MADNAQPMLQRACRLSLEFATTKKRHEIGHLLEAYRGAVSFNVRSLGSRTARQTDARTAAGRTHPACSRCKRIRRCASAPEAS
jgi:hypothetical protein